jgi:hypothetical protein
LKHEIRREPFSIPADGLIQPLRLDRVHGRQSRIEKQALSAKHQDGIRDSLDRDQGSRHADYGGAMEMQRSGMGANWREHASHEPGYGTAIAEPAYCSWRGLVRIRSRLRLRD